MKLNAENFAESLREMCNAVAPTVKAETRLSQSASGALIRARQLLQEWDKDRAQRHAAHKANIGKDREHHMAVDFLDRLFRDNLVPAADIVAVLSLTCVLAVITWNKANPKTGSDMARVALRNLIENLSKNGVTIPDLGLEDCTLIRSAPTKH